MSRDARQIAVPEPGRERVTGPFAAGADVTPAVMDFPLISAPEARVPWPEVGA